MVKEGIDPYVAEATARRTLAEARENYAVQTQMLAQLSTRTKFVNMDTGEISYATLTEDGRVIEGSTAPVAQSRTATPPPQSTDPEAAFRRARLGVVAVIVLVLFWIWIRQRTAARD